MCLLGWQRFSEARRESVERRLVGMVGTQGVDAVLACVGKRTLSLKNVEIREGAAVVALLRQRKRTLGLGDDLLLRRRDCRLCSARARATDP